MKTSIIIPCYNEQKTIKELVQKVYLLNIDKEIIIVDDGSTDGTKDILKNDIESLGIKVIYQNNSGKGAALINGFNNATGDIVIPQDADLELNPKDIIKVINPIIRGESKAASGSRFLNQKMRGGLMHRLANFTLTKFSTICFKQKITDVNTCYVAFRRELLEQLNLKEQKFAINEEIFGKLSRLNIKIIESQVEYNPRTRRQGKKVHYKDGFDALKAIWKYKKL